MTQPTYARRGQFGGAALAGARVFDATELVDDREHLGLPREATYCWGTARNADGDLFVLARRMAAPGATRAEGVAPGEVQHSLSDRFILQSTLGGCDHPRLRREGRFTPVADLVERSIDDGRAVFRIPESDQRGAMELIAGDDAISYEEAAVISLSGERIGPALHWYLPCGPSALYYPTQTWAVAGNILGEAVEGFLFIEEAYMPQGGRLYVRHDPLQAVRYRLWYSWATTWDDGTTEFGHFVANDGAFSVGIIANADGSARFANRVSATIERGDDRYWFDRIALDVDGEPWEIVADARGRMADLGAIPNPQQEALVRRVGETRTPITWMAWGESVPANDPS
jgi:hypothetical protein